MAINSILTVAANLMFRSAKITKRAGDDGSGLLSHCRDDRSLIAGAVPRHKRRQRSASLFCRRRQLVYRYRYARLEIVTGYTVCLYLTRKSRLTYRSRIYARLVIAVR